VKLSLGILSYNSGIHPYYEKIYLVGIDFYKSNKNVSYFEYKK
jgi:hypothetical protein